jgi:hypothetical protein
MISTDEARRFAEDWVAAWNAHDLDRILSHYADDFEMSSPFIAKLAGEPSGTLRGKASVGAYWRRALAHVPDLHFELLGVFLGADSVVIHYRAVFGLLACEVFCFNPDGKVSRAAAHYDRV